MKKLLILLPVVALIAAGCNKTTTTTPTSTSNEMGQRTEELGQNNGGMSGWVTYENNAKGYQFQHPADWKAGTDGQSLFTFTTSKGATARLQSGTLAPFTFDEARINAEKAASPSRTIMIGTEEGLRTSAIVCGSAASDSCSAVFNYKSNGITSKGFEFEVVIPVTDVQIGRPAAMIQDPSTLFVSDLEDIEQALATL
jgi:hypothetical protein